MLICIFKMQLFWWFQSLTSPWGTKKLTSSTIIDGLCFPYEPNVIFAILIFTEFSKSVNINHLRQRKIILLPFLINKVSLYFLDTF